MGGRIIAAGALLDSGLPPVEITVSSADTVHRTSFITYLIAVLLGLFAGWVNQRVDDALLTALCVLAFSMAMGSWKPARPWRWGLLVWIGVPLVLAYYHLVVRWPHNRGQVYGAFLQILAASAGAFGGHFMRQMIDNVFRAER